MSDIRDANDLHAAIMNVQADSDTLRGLANAVERAVYKLGHRDARHAAAELVSTARDCNPEKDGAPGDGTVPAAGNLRIAVEEALESIEAGMVQGAADTLREALNVGVLSDGKPSASRSQKLAAAGFTRRPTWRALPPDDDAGEPQP